MVKKRPTPLQSHLNDAPFTGAGYGPKTARKALWLYAYACARTTAQAEGSEFGEFFGLSVSW